jgi:ABC-type nitrate/sulfonate/bicarbonate transport system substrate-binding protein
MDINEMLRRDVVRLMGLGGAGLLLAPGAALADDKTTFRMDQQNAIHFLAGTFIPKFLTKPVDWEVKKFASSGQGRVSALARGAIDGIMTSWTYLIQICASDFPATCISGMAGGGSRLLVQPNSTIKSYADLKGKKVGVVEFSFQDILFIYAAKAKGIDPFKEIKRVNLGSPAGVVAAMTTGQVDACAIWEPYASILMIEKGAKMISNLGDDSFGRSNGGLFVNNAFIKNHPDIAQDVVQAVIKATDYVEKDKGAWIDRAEHVTGQNKAVATKAVDNCFPSVDIPMKTLRQIAKAMYELGVQSRDVSADLPKVIDYSFLEKATGKKKEQLGYVA